MPTSVGNDQHQPRAKLRRSLCIPEVGATAAIEQQEADLQDVRIHDLRHFCATRADFLTAKKDHKALEYNANIMLSESFLNPPILICNQIVSGLSPTPDAPSTALSHIPGILDSGRSRKTRGYVQMVRWSNENDR